MDANREDLLRMVDSWGQVPSDPLLSEHTRLAISDGTAGIYQVGGIDAVASLAATSNMGVGLVEIAAKTHEQGALLWDSVEDELARGAKAAGFSKVEVVDRGSSFTGVASPVVRSIVRMVNDQPRSGPDISSGVYVPSDGPEMLEIIQEAFRGHPENGSWSIADIQRRTGAADFDPGQILIRRNGKEIAGFCWTKVHTDGVGEIYLLAIAKRWRGRGLGKALVEEGLSRLVVRDGCDEIIVYTDSDNQSAVSLYESVGFRVDRVDRRYEMIL
jgi:ribosomal protein S18 acetylase RimI-like enzyme